MSQIRNVMLASVTLAFTAQVAYALPKGKPFVELNGQIVEIQGDVQALELDLEAFKQEVDAKFDDLESRIAAIDTKILALEAEDKRLAEEIGNVLATAMENSELISGLLETVGQMEDSIAVAEENIAYLLQQEIVDDVAIQQNKDDIAAAEAEIADAWTQISANVEGIATLDAQKVDIHNFIEQLAQMKEDFDADLAQKQDILDITCAAEEAISEISQDGSFSCTSTASTTNGLQRITEYGPWVTVPRAVRYQSGSRYVTDYCHRHSVFGSSHCHGHYEPIYSIRPSYATAYATCTSGSLKTSATYQVSYAALYTQGPHGAEGHRVTARNSNLYNEGQVRAVVSCIGIAP